MIHHCKCECRKHDKDTEELLGTSPSIWMDFAFCLDTVNAIKLSSMDEDDFDYGGTIVYMPDRTFVIDTPYKVFEKIWVEYITGTKIEDDLDL